MKRKRIIWISLALLLLIFAGIILWAQDARRAQAQALNAMQGSSSVRVEEDIWITFTPYNTTPTVGIIFYPGGKVEPQAYAPLLLALAESNYLVVDVPMPFNLAVLGIGRAAEVIAAYPDVQTWVIGGHSLGGAMAANFVFNHPDQIDGLYLWGSYPAESNSLADYDLAVISIYGSEDGGAEEIAASSTRLPATTTWLRIQGGNHAQFGDYGEQEGDGKASISAEAQGNLILDAMLTYLESLTE
jgi:dienelactone hydrolase